MSLPVNEDHFNQWLAAMRDPASVQGEGMLCEWKPESKGYCCLGLGSTLVPGLRIEFNLHSDDESLDEEGADPEGRIGSVSFGSDGATELAPREFIEWLGLPYSPIRAGWHPPAPAQDYDIFPDYPLGLAVQGSAPDSVQRTDPGETLMAAASASMMNDSGFTFPQIADVFAYFGIGKVVGK